MSNTYKLCNTYEQESKDLQEIEAEEHYSFAVSTEVFVNLLCYYHILAAAILE